MTSLRTVTEGLSTDEPLIVKLDLGNHCCGGWEGLGCGCWICAAGLDMCIRSFGAVVMLSMNLTATGLLFPCFLYTWV